MEGFPYCIALGCHESATHCIPNTKQFYCYTHWKQFVQTPEGKKALRYIKDAETRYKKAQKLMEERGI